MNHNMSTCDALSQLDHQKNLGFITQRNMFYKKSEIQNDKNLQNYDEPNKFARQHSYDSLPQKKPYDNVYEQVIYDVPSQQLAPVTSFPIMLSSNYTEGNSETLRLSIFGQENIYDVPKPQASICYNQNGFSNMSESTLNSCITGKPIFVNEKRESSPYELNSEEMKRNYVSKSESHVKYNDIIQFMSDMVQQVHQNCSKLEKMQTSDWKDHQAKSLLHDIMSCCYLLKYSLRKLISFGCEIITKVKIKYKILYDKLWLLISLLKNSVLELEKRMCKIENVLDLMIETFDMNENLSALFEVQKNVKENVVHFAVAVEHNFNELFSNTIMCNEEPLQNLISDMCHNYLPSAKNTKGFSYDQIKCNSNEELLRPKSENVGNLNEKFRRFGTFVKANASDNCSDYDSVIANPKEQLVCCQLINQSWSEPQLPMCENNKILLCDDDRVLLTYYYNVICDEIDNIHTMYHNIESILHDKNLFIELFLKTKQIFIQTFSLIYIADALVRILHNGKISSLFTDITHKLYESIKSMYSSCKMITSDYSPSTVQEMLLFVLNVLQMSRYFYFVLHLVLS